MKFQQGRLVEVLRRVEAPHESWFTGNIISVGDDYYIVKYDSLADLHCEPVMEKVNKDDVRPQPPKKGAKKWTVGDVAEVFDSHSWRFGKILKILKNNLFVIRLFGSIQLREFHESKLRIVQTWHDNKWSVTDKVAQNKESTNNFRQNDLKLSGILSNSSPLKAVGNHSCLRKRNKQRRLKDGNSNVKKCLPTTMVNGRNTYCLDRSSKNQGECHEPLLRVIPSVRRVDDLSLRKVRHRERFNRGLNEVEACVEKATANWPSNCSKPIETETEESDHCSVASCSSNNFCDFLNQNCDRAQQNFSDNLDAESSFPSSSVNLCSTPHFEQKLEADIHELEFHAYESTVKALYASGPLTWEQESLLTNLRLSLNISDEEHLLQLRHLLSTRVI